MELCRYPEKGNTRTFHIKAIQIPIVYNRFGDYDPDGLLYVLEEEADRIEQEARRRFEMDPPQPYEEVQSLVIRVNLGEPLTHDMADSGEDISMSSWVYRDPAPPILHAYVGDPAKIRFPQS